MVLSLIRAKRQAQRIGGSNQGPRKEGWCVGPAFCSWPAQPLGLGGDFSQWGPACAQAKPLVRMRVPLPRIRTASRIRCLSLGGAIARWSRLTCGTRMLAGKLRRSEPGAASRRDPAAQAPSALSGAFEQLISGLVTPVARAWSNIGPSKKGLVIGACRPKMSPS